VSKESKMEKEITEIDRIINQFFSVFDNRNERTPDLDDIRKFFVEGAIITKKDKDALELMSIDDFIEPRRNLLIDGTLVDFFEYELDSVTRVDNNIASRMSEYAKEGIMNGEEYKGGGKKHFQLVLKNDSWKIVSIIWEDY